MELRGVVHKADILEKQKIDVNVCNNKNMQKIEQRQSLGAFFLYSFYRPEKLLRQHVPRSLLLEQGRILHTDLLCVSNNEETSMIEEKP